MPELILQIDLPAHQLHAYYRGEIRVVRARASTGQMVQFPASALQRHFTKEGVRGQFRMAFDENNKFIALERVAGAEPEAAAQDNAAAPEQTSGDEGLRRDGFPWVMRA